jgi:hypothetical protein
MTLSDRDRLIQERATEKTRLTNEKKRVADLAQAALAEVEALEEPRKRLERLQTEGASLSAQAGNAERIFRREIEKLAPACLSNALAKVKSLEPALGFDACNRATGQLEKLLFTPGDVTQAVNDILGELFGSVQKEVSGRDARQLLAS